MHKQIYVNHCLVVRQPCAV